MSIGEEVRKRTAEIEKMLPRLERDLQVLQTEVKALRKEKRELARVLRQLDGPVSDGAPAVTDEQVLGAVATLGGSCIDSGAVAGHLDVTKRHVARKLRKLVDNGELTGNPEAGYTLVAVAA